MGLKIKAGCLQTRLRGCDYMETKIGAALTLIDGAYNIVELWEAKTPYQKQWKKRWLATAKKLVDGLVQNSNKD